MQREQGKNATIMHDAALRNFQAPRLGRRFDLVVFEEGGEGVGGGEERRLRPNRSLRMTH